MNNKEDMLISLLKDKKKTDNVINCKKLSAKNLQALDVANFALFHIEELTFEDNSPRKEALENVISSLDIDGINFIYLLVGDKTKVAFYFGIAKIFNYNKELEINIDDIGKRILKPSIEGNFRGSKVTIQDIDSRKSILEQIKNFERIGRIDGVPSVNNEREEFQGVDRLVDVMFGDEFALMIIADPLNSTEISSIEDSLYEIHDKLAPLSKKSIQSTSSSSNTTGTSETKNESKSKTKDEGKSKTSTNTSSKSASKSTSKGTKDSTSESANEETSDSVASATTESSSTSETNGFSATKNTSEATNTGSSESREFTNKFIQTWLEYVDNVLLTRLTYGKNKGLFYSGIYVFANKIGVIKKLGNTIKGLFSGTEQNKAPLKFCYVENEPEKNFITNLQLPLYDEMSEGNEHRLRVLYSKTNSKLASWLSTNELSVISSLPKKEILGLALKEEVEFGLNIKKQSIQPDNQLLLGHLVKSGNVLENIEIFIDKEHLNKHIFIAGVTGSGKTTTCQRILNSANAHFLVIEPAKTEYRVLLKSRDDILIFTLGDEKVAPFRINPFEFFEGENITSRVDMIKANIEAAFDMEAAIPQIIEKALYDCYESYGWNISTSTNSEHENPFANGVQAFPTFTDLIKQTEKVVEEQGFDDRLKNDYIGSIKARLQSLLVGAKGRMLNTPRSIDFLDLLEKNVILELEEIKNGAEKSLIMGFVLINLNEALKKKHKNDQDFRHITLIEEAHRLLSRYIPGENPSKKLGVETFSDMLAEVRKYGESLIIVDQIPNKLTPEVLKNTNTKIVHRLFASDDKDAIGNTMALDDEQKEFLSSLDTGRAIVSNIDFIKPIQVKIKELENTSTTKDDEIPTEQICELCLKYYQENYKKGIIPALDNFEKMPSLEEVRDFLSFDYATVFNFWKTQFTVGRITGSTNELKEILRKTHFLDGYEKHKKHLLNNFYRLRNDKHEIEEHLDSFIEMLRKDTIEYFTRNESFLFKIIYT